MKTGILTLLLLTLLVYDTDAATTSVVNSAYFQFTQGDVSDTFYDVTKFTHITYAWAILDETFSPWPFVDDGGTMDSFVANLRRNANNTATAAFPGRAPLAILSVGGPISNATLFSVMVASRQNRRTFIRNSVARARALGFDGLDLDWRSPTTAADMRNLATLLKEWRAAVAAENATRPLILTATVNYAPKSAANPAISYPVSVIVNYLDWVNLLSFEIYPWLDANATAHESPIHASGGGGGIYSVDYGVRSWISAGLPASRAVIGLSDYSYSWFLKTRQHGLGAPVSGSAYVYAYPTILQEAKKYNGSCVEDKVAVGAYCYYYMTPVKKTVWGSFDSIASIDAKIQYLKGLGLRGFFFHRLLGRSSELLSTALNAIKSNKH